MGERVLVTGGSGFIGRALTVALKSRGDLVLALQSMSPRVPCPGCLPVNLLDREETRRVFREFNPTHVVHLAFDKNREFAGRRAFQQIETNILLSLNVIEAASAVGCLKRLIYLGSCDEYGSIDTPYLETVREMPASSYGYSKNAVTRLLQMAHASSALPAVILRPSIVYGPGQGLDMFIPSLTWAMIEGRRYPMTRGEQQRDFVYIDDLVEAVIKAIDSEGRIDGEIINIASGGSERMATVANYIADLVRDGARALIDVGGISYRPATVMNYSVSTDKAASLLRWTSKIDFREGLLRTVEYFRFISR